MGLVHWIKRHSPTILTVFGVLGTIATAALAAKEAPNALMAMYRAEGEAEDELTVLDKAKVMTPFYLPAAMVGLSTIACIVGANVVNQKHQAALLSAYALLESTYQEYKDKVSSIVGPQANRVVEKAMTQKKVDDPHFAFDEPQTFYEEHYGKFFELTMQQVMQAEYHINRNLVLKGSVKLNEFYDFLGLDHTKTGDEIGWDQYEGEIYWGYTWIDFQHRYFETDDGLTVCAIDMPFEPHEEEAEDGPPDDPPDDL